MNKFSCCVDWILCGCTLQEELYMFVLISPLFLIDKMHYFAYTSTAGVLLLIFNLIIICYAAFAKIEGTNAQDLEFVEFLPQKIYFMEMFATFGGIIWTFESVTIIFHVRSSMKRPQDFLKVAKAVFIMAGISFILFG